MDKGIILFFKQIEVIAEMRIDLVPIDSKTIQLGIILNERQKQAKGILDLIKSNDFDGDMNRTEFVLFEQSNIALKEILCL